jgi:hypothetical protein
VGKTAHVGLLGEMMATIGDRLRNVWKNYIAPTKEEIKIGRKEIMIQSGDTLTPENKTSMGHLKKLSPKQCRNAAEQCPLFMKGARKKAGDSVRAWHNIETADAKKKVPQQDLNIINLFTKRNNLKLKWYEAKIASYIYGDGYLLITFDKDNKTSIHDPPAEGAVPWKVTLLNSENITEIDYYPEQKKYYKERATKHFHYTSINATPTADYWIHPDRLIHFVCDKLPHKEFGTSKVNLLRNIIKSMINIDIACGEILAWFAHAMLDVTQENMQDPEEKKWKDTCNRHPGAVIHDETAEVKMLAPEAIDPKPFYDYLILKVAATFQMPTHILTGIQVGKVTGAEVGTGDYIKDVKDDQDLQDTPLLERLYSMLLEAKGRKWKYEIVWNPIYIDELAEAEIMLKRTQAADLAMNGSRGVGGFVNPKEAREVFNRGQVVLDESVPSDLKEPTGPVSPQPKDEESESDGEQNTREPKDLYNHQLDVATKAMIEKRKLQSEKEKKLGEEILKEQNDNDKNES